MAQAGVSLTKLYWYRSCSAGWTLLLFLQNTLLTSLGVLPINLRKSNQAQKVQENK
jgi:hypothetical protein